MPIAKSLFQSILWKGLVYLSTFVLNILIARHFEAAFSGTIYYIINIFSFVHLATALSLESGIIYTVSKKLIDPLKLLNFSLTWTIIVSLMLWLVMKTPGNSSYTGITTAQLHRYALYFI